MATKKDNEGEKALCRTMLVVSLRDMLSSGSNYYSKKCKTEAKDWLDTTDESYFSFSNVADFLFEEVDPEVLKERLSRMLKDRKVRGTRNLIKILSEINIDEEENNEE